MDHKSQVGKLPIFSRQLKWNDCFSTAPGTNAWLPIFQKKTFFHRRSSLSDPSVWKNFVPKQSHHLVAHGASELGSWYGVSKAKDTELMTMTKRTTSGGKTRDSCVENDLIASRERRVEKTPTDSRIPLVTQARLERVMAFHSMASAKNYQ